MHGPAPKEEGMRHLLAVLGTATLVIVAVGHAEEPQTLDQRVEAVLEHMRGEWRDLNIPERDGRLLYEIVLQKGYKQALEVGTSTGRSALWIGWALSKTGGTLITLEIDETRHRQAKELFAEAGLGDIIDARLGDAHQLVEKLPGPFDFVFIDADKGWYTNYAKTLIPKLTSGGCVTAHNVRHPRSRRRGHGHAGTAAYFDLMRGLPEFDTSVHPGSPSGLCVSYHKTQ